MQLLHSAFKNIKVIGRTHIIDRLNAVPDVDHCDADVRRFLLLKQ